MVAKAWLLPQDLEVLATVHLVSGSRWESTDAHMSSLFSPSESVQNLSPWACAITFRVGLLSSVKSHRNALTYPDLLP